ncbi:integrase core domain-containing protein [Pontiellaceae bacterium B12227]|nr:integrase core domain-containing protein [Pontiellaceae bacterium B12227]
MLFEARYRKRYDARLQLLAYQIEMLRSRINTDRIYTCPEERAKLVRLGEELEHDIDDVLLVVKPDTYRGWLRPKESSKPQKPGRPGTPQATVNLVMRFAVENLTWGYKRIQGELKKLGIHIGATTISDILKRANHHPIPDKGSSRPPGQWKQFISSHMDTLAATDFFTKPVLTWRGWVDAYVLVFIHLGSRHVLMSPATFNPTEDWVLQQSRNAAMRFEDMGIKIRYLIHDRDTKYSRRFRAFWESEKARCIQTPVRTPVANSYAECYIGKVKRECLNHFFCVSLDQLDYINREWLAYYNEQRPHQGTDIGNKVLRPDFTPATEGEIKLEQRLGGIISYYYREAA